MHVYGGTTAHIEAQGEVTFLIDTTSLLTVSLGISGGVTVAVNGSVVQFFINNIQ